MTIKNFISPLRVLVGLLACSAVCLAQGDKAVTPAPAVADTAAKATATPGFNDRSPRYHLQPGDTFDVNFDLSPEFNQTAIAVQPDGFVTLRSVGDVKVSGQTIPELTATVRHAYSKILNNPPISVNLKEFEKPYFVADGQVAKPGKYELHGQHDIDAGGRDCWWLSIEPPSTHRCCSSTGSTISGPKRS